MRLQLSQIGPHKFARMLVMKIGTRNRRASQAFEIKLNYCFNISVKKALKVHGGREKESIVKELFKMDHYNGSIFIDPVYMENMNPYQKKSHILVYVSKGEF